MQFDVGVPGSWRPPTDGLAEKRVKFESTKCAPISVRKRTFSPSTPKGIRSGVYVFSYTRFRLKRSSSSFGIGPRLAWVFFGSACLGVYLGGR